MASGYIIIDRSVFTHRVFRDKAFTEREAWLWMISQAAYKAHKVETKYGSINLDRGEFFSSIRRMADQFKWSKSTVQRFVKKLENEAMISIHRGTLNGTLNGTLSYQKNGTPVTTIKVIKYNAFQNLENYNGTINLEGDGTLNGTLNGTRLKKGLENKDKKEENTMSEKHGNSSGRKKGPRAPDLSEEMVRIWNEILQDTKVHKITKTSIKRRARLATTFHDFCDGDFDQWRQLCLRISMSPFLTGKTSDFRMGIDWIMNPENLEKIFDGKYDVEPGEDHREVDRKDRTPFEQALYLWHMSGEEGEKPAPGDFKPV